MGATTPSAGRPARRARMPAPPCRRRESRWFTKLALDFGATPRRIDDDRGFDAAALERLQPLVEGHELLFAIATMKHQRIRLLTPAAQTVPNADEPLMPDM